MCPTSFANSIVLGKDIKRSVHFYLWTVFCWTLFLQKAGFNEQKVNKNNYLFRFYEYLLSVTGYVPSIMNMQMSFTHSPYDEGLFIVSQRLVKSRCETYDYR